MPSQDIPQDPTKSVLEQMNADVVGVVWDRGEDKSVKGLHLRIFASGKRCFYFLYTTKHGLRRRPKIGEGIGLTEARKIAANLRAQVYMGLDPHGIRDTKRKENTIAEAFNYVMENYWHQPRFVASGRRGEVANIFKSKIENSFGSRKLSDIRASEIRQWHDKMSRTPFMANRALEVLAKIYSFAIEQEWIERNPCLIVKAFPERKRKRVSSEDEVRVLLHELLRIARDSNDRDQSAAVFILGLFYTGARPKMLKDVMWEDEVSSSITGAHFALKGKMSSVFGENEKLFVPKQVMDFLVRIPGEKLFDARRIRHLWLRLKEKFDIKDLWIRDARKTFASIGLKAGLTIDQIGETLNHRSAQTTMIYAKEFSQSNTQVVLKIASELDKILEGDPI